MPAEVLMPAPAYQYASLAAVQLLRKSSKRTMTMIRFAFPSLIRRATSSKPGWSPCFTPGKVCQVTCAAAALEPAIRIERAEETKRESEDGGVSGAGAAMVRSGIKSASLRSMSSVNALASATEDGTGEVRRKSREGAFAEGRAAIGRARSQESVEVEDYTECIEKTASHCT